jgi:hypothetical protein
MLRSCRITIVSVGDSYASGEGAPDQPGPFAGPQIWHGDNRDGMASSCHRSNLAAPAVAAKLVGDQRMQSPYSITQHGPSSGCQVGWRSVPRQFLHIACSGEKISELTGPGGQLDTAAALAAGPIDALIISIGGNDIEFGSIVGACLAIPCESILLESFPGAAIDLAPRIAAINTAIRTLPVPVRHVFVTEYPDPSTTLFPPPDNRCGIPFAPNIPLAGFDTLLPSSAEWAADIVIAPLTERYPAESPAPIRHHRGGPMWHFVGGISTAFHGHGYCMGLPNILLPLPHMLLTNRMINTVADSLATQGDIKGTMHPNADGHRAAASVIAGAIIANVPVEIIPTPVPPTRKTPAPRPGKVCIKKPWTPGCEDFSEL